MPFMISIITHDLQHYNKAITFVDGDYVRIEVVLILVKSFNNKSIKLFSLRDKSTVTRSNHRVIRIKQTKMRRQ